MTTAAIRSCVLCVLMSASGAVFAADLPATPPPNEAIQAAVKRHTAATTRRFEEPDAAAELYWQKRQGPNPSFDTAAAYRNALKHMDRMPRYSSRLGTQLETRPGASLGGVASFAAKRLLGVWESLGPGNIGGRTRALLIHPTQTEIMYTAGVSGGVWKTIDGGVNWFPLADEIANIAVNSMAMRPDDPETLYIGTGEGYFREEVRGTWLPLRGAGVFRSSNGGTSWARLESTEGEDFHWVNDLIISTKDSDRIYAATRTGVHISSDGGATWDHSLVSTQKGGCLDLAVRDDHATDWLFASCGTLDQATVYRRRIAAGTTWEPVLSQPGMGRTTLAIAPSAQNIIYALSASNSSGPSGVYEQGLHAVFRSGSGGAAGTWETRVTNTDPDRVNTLILTNPVTSSYTDCGWATYNPWVPMGWYCNVIAVDPIDPNVVWAAGVDLFRSDNGGRDWGVASYWWAAGQDPSFVHADQHAIVFHPDFDGAGNTRMFTASDGGIFSTDNPYGLVATSIFVTPASHGSSSKATTTTWGSPSSTMEHLIRAVNATSAAPRTTAPSSVSTLSAPIAGTTFSAATEATRRWTPSRPTWSTQRANASVSPSPPMGAAPTPTQSMESTTAVFSSSRRSPWMSTNLNDCGPAATACGGPTTRPGCGTRPAGIPSVPVRSAPSPSPRGTPSA